MVTKSGEQDNLECTAMMYFPVQISLNTPTLFKESKVVISWLPTRAFVYVKSYHLIFIFNVRFPFRFITFQTIARVIFPKLIYQHVNNNNGQCCRLLYAKNSSYVNLFKLYNSPLKQGQHLYSQFPKEKLKLREVSIACTVVLEAWHQSPLSYPLLLQ